MAEEAAAAGQLCAATVGFGVRAWWFHKLGARELGAEALESVLATSSHCNHCPTYALRLAATVADEPQQAMVFAQESRQKALAFQAEPFGPTLLGAALNVEGRSARNMGLLELAASHFSEALSLTRGRLDPVVPVCPTIPTESIRAGYHTSSFSNLAAVLASIGTPLAIAESLAMLPDVRKSYGPRDHLPRAKVYWLAGKLDASRWPTASTPQKKTDIRRKAERQWSWAFKGLLEHGPPHDAVMCLLEMCAAPWVRTPEADILARLNTRDLEQRRQLNAALEALDPEVAARVDDLRRRAEAAAVEIEATSRTTMGKTWRNTTTARIREDVSVELHRCLRWLVAAGALPPIHARTVGPAVGLDDETRKASPLYRRGFAFGW